jgi:hypothetical protein
MGIVGRRSPRAYKERRQKIYASIEREHAREIRRDPEPIEPEAPEPEPEIEDEECQASHRCAR